MRIMNPHQAGANAEFAEHDFVYFVDRFRGTCALDSLAQPAGDSLFLDVENKCYCKINGAAVRLTTKFAKILIRRARPPRAGSRNFSGGRRSADRNVS